MGETGILIGDCMSLTLHSGEAQRCYQLHCVDLVFQNQVIHVLVVQPFWIIITNKVWHN